MQTNREITKFLVLFISPLVTSLSVAASPSLAATFALSSGVFSLNYSLSPQNNDLPSVEVTSATDSFTWAKPGSSVTAIPDADAGFVASQQLFFNTSESFAKGSGKDYLGIAKSQAEVVANFSILKGQSFSFDFTGALRLFTDIDSPRYEKATASGDISLALVDITDPENETVLEFFTVFGNLVTPETQPWERDFLDYRVSQNISLDINLFKDFEGNTESADAFFTGSYVKDNFESDTRLALKEIKTNQATVKAPEPSSTLALVIGFGTAVIWFGVKSKRARARFVATELN